MPRREFLPRLLLSLALNLLVFLVILLGALGLSACNVASGGAKATPTIVPTPVVAQKPTYTVARGDISKVLELRGRVVPIKQQDLVFETEGYVKEIFFSRGDTVQAGDLLARLEEPANYAANLAAAGLALEQAQFDLAQLKLDAPVKLAEAQLELIKAQDTLTKTQTKRTNMDVPRVRDPLALEKAEQDFAAADQAYKEAQDAYNSASSLPEGDPQRSNALSWLIEARRSFYQALGNLNYSQGKAGAQEIAQADADLAVARAKYERALAEVQRLSDPAGTLELRLAEAKVTDAQAKVESVKKSKQDVELRAPFGGEITSIAITPGDQVSARKIVMTLADPSALEISVVPSSEELAEMGVGQAVAVRLTSQQGKDLPGHVRLLPDLSATGDKKDPSARIVLEDASIPLKINESAGVIVEIETRQQVLWLPPAALRQFQGRDFVFVEEDGVPRRLDIRLGLASADRIEIVSGLEEGQVVVGP